jgi:hypothetical protein
MANGCVTYQRGSEKGCQTCQGGSLSFCYQFPEHIQTPLRFAGRAVGIKAFGGSHEC